MAVGLIGRKIHLSGLRAIAEAKGLMSTRAVGHFQQVRPAALCIAAAISPGGPYRWPLLDGTLAYLSRHGEVEWRAPRAHPERSPAAGVEWWWSVPLSEMVLRLAELGVDPVAIASDLNVDGSAVDHFIRRAKAEARRQDARAEPLSL